MKYLISFDNIYLSVELRKDESKTVEFKIGSSLKHVVLTAGKVIREPTNTHTGSGLVRMQFVESRNTTSEICTIAKIKESIIQPYRSTVKRNDMKKSPLREQIKEAATKVCQVLNALQGIERQFDDDLVDENGKNVEAEYYALRNAIASVKSAYDEIKDI